MEKYVYDENNGLWYELQGDYYIHCLALPTDGKAPSAFGGKGTCGTSRRNVRLCTQSY